MEKCLGHSGSYFYNYKHFNSIVLLALVDANFKFLCVDVGRNGRSYDGSVFANSTLFQFLENQRLHVPGDKPLPDRHTSGRE